MTKRITATFFSALLLLAATPLIATTSGSVKPSQILSHDGGIQPFGSNLFSGNFLKTREDGLNPDYKIATGDQVAVRIWGALSVNELFTVDGQGNIFLPEIGPLQLAGIRNADLTTRVRGHVNNVYSNNFDVYTNLVTAQPVAVYVTGLVNNPGRYAGIPSDTILYFLDLAGGIDPRLGSYRNIAIMRNGSPVAEIDLYDFLLDGSIAAPQLRDSDTILVRHRGPVIRLEGNVAQPTLIELKSEQSTGSDVLGIIPNAATATEVTLSGMRNNAPFNRTLPVDLFTTFTLENGDRVTLRDGGRAETILVNIEGEFSGPSMLAVKRGARLVDVLNYIPVDAELANSEAVYIRRKSVAKTQKDALNDSLFRLQRSTMLALSGSSNEASIRTQEAKLMEKFAERVRLINPLGRVVTSHDNVQQNIILEPGDTIVIPSRTQIITIGGEVLMTQAVTYQPGWSVEEYVKRAGGYSRRANRSEAIIHHPNAAVEISHTGTTVKPGDEIIIPPKVDTKGRQFAMDLMQIIYQIAISAKVALNL